MNTHEIDIHTAIMDVITDVWDRAKQINEAAYEILDLIEADRKRRDEPVAWIRVAKTWDGRPVVVIAKPYQEGAKPVYLAPQPLSESDIPADPSSSEPGVTTTQALITLGKVIAGYRPGEEGWSEYDQQAYDAAMSIPQPLGGSDMFVELVAGLSAEQLAEILSAYIKPEIVGEALEKLENAPWELSEPVAADFPVKGKLHGPLGWIANTTNPEPVKGEPVGYFYPWELERSLKVYPNGFPGAVAVYAHPQPAEPVSTHHVHRGVESLPCYCKGKDDHPIGKETLEPVNHSVQDCPEVDKWNCKYCERVNSCPVQGHRDAQPAEPTPVQARMAKLRTDPVKAAALDRARERIHAELAKSSEPVKILGRNPTTVIMDEVNPVKVDAKASVLSDSDVKHVQDFINCDGMGAVIVEGPQYSAVVRALLARYR